MVLMPVQKPLPHDSAAEVRELGLGRLGRAGVQVAFLFGLLVARHADTLWLPPYEDQAVGLWAEAEFLLENDFDYFKLRYDEAHFNSPGHGARSYMVSVLPTIVAVLMKLSPSREISFFVGHLLTLASTALTGYFVFALVRPYSVWTAALTVAALLTTPLMEVQAEMLGMDMPVALCAVATLGLLSRERYFLAAVAGTLAFLCKPTGSLATAATICCLAMLCYAGPVVRRRAGVGLLVNLAALAFQIGLFIWGDPLPELRSAIPWPKSLRLPYGVLLFPDVAMVIVAAALLTALAAFRQWGAQRQRAHTALQTVRWLIESYGDRLPLVFSWLMIGGMFASMLRWIAMPRYFTAAMPFVYVALVTAWLTLPWRRSWLHAALAGLLAFNLANRAGQYFPEMRRLADADLAADAVLSIHSCAFQERSREYLAEQRGMLALFAELERAHGQRPLLAPRPYSFLARLPRLGYVTTPLEVYEATDFGATLVAFCQLQRAARQEGAQREPALLVANLSRVVLPAPTSRDQIIARGTGPDEVLCYLKNSAELPANDDELLEWYWEATWATSWPARRTIDRLGSLAPYGQSRRVLTDVERSAQISEDQADDAAFASRQFPRLAQSDARAAVQAASVELLFPNPPSQALQGETRLDLHRAVLRRATVVALEEVDADAGRIALAVMHLQQGNLLAAEQALLQLQDATAAERDYLRAYIAWQRGRIDETIEIASAALQRTGELVGLHKLLGLALARKGNDATARQAFLTCERLGYSDPQTWDLLRAVTKAPADAGHLP